MPVQSRPGTPGDRGRPGNWRGSCQSGVSQPSRILLRMPGPRIKQHWAPRARGTQGTRWGWPTAPTGPLTRPLPLRRQAGPAWTGTGTLAASWRARQTAKAGPTGELRRGGPAPAPLPASWRSAACQVRPRDCAALAAPPTAPPAQLSGRGRGLGGGRQTFWGPCSADPLCSLLCVLGRMVGGNVQMGPCSPSSASPSLWGGREHEGWGLRPRRSRAHARASPLHAGAALHRLPSHWHLSPAKWGRCLRHGAQGRAPPGISHPKGQALHVGVLRAGLLAVALRLPALVAVNELSEEGCLLGVARDELVLQELPGRGPLPGDARGSRPRPPARGRRGSAWGLQQAQQPALWDGSVRGPGGGTSKARVGLAGGGASADPPEGGPCQATCSQPTPRAGASRLTNRGSLLRQASTNSLKGLLWWPSSTGGLFLGIRNRTRMGWRSEFGGSPLASSMAVIPSDQMSA